MLYTNLAGADNEIIIGGDAIIQSTVGKNSMLTTGVPPWWTSSTLDVKSFMLPEASQHSGRRHDPRNIPAISFQYANLCVYKAVWTEIEDGGYTTRDLLQEK